MEIKYWAGTDVGRKRSDNEDNFLIDKRLRLFVVADGMGGHASGEIASAMAVHGIREVLDQERDILDVYDDDDPKSHVEVCTLLEYAVHHTCAQIFYKARREPEKRGMGTTLVVLLVIGARGFIAYVGDSRIYLLRGGVVYQLTEDHSLRNELIRMGKITADEFETSPYANLKNAMTRAVGVYESVEVDTLDFDIIPGDSFLLCSDGLYEYLSDDDIANAIALPEIREIPGMLIDAANSRGGKDNITAVVVQVAGDANDDDRAAELNFTLDTLKNVPLFRELSYQQLVRVINLARQSALGPEQVLCREGEPGQELIVVLRGRLVLTRGGVHVAELGAGAHLGEMSLIDAGPRSVTATALEPGKVLAITRDDFYEVLRREPALAVKLLWSFVRVLSDRLRSTTADLAVARTTAAHAVPDLTELAEDAARSEPGRPVIAPVVDPMREPDDFREAVELGEAETETHLGELGDLDDLDDLGDLDPLDEDAPEDEDDLERRPTMVAGMRGPNPASQPEPRAAPERTDPAATSDPRPVQSTTPRSPTPVSPAAPVSSASRAEAGPVTGPVRTGETVPPPSAAPRPQPPSGQVQTGHTLIPASAAVRPRRGPQVTKPNQATAWTPSLQPMTGPSVVASPQAPTRPLQAPHLLPPPETDAPKTRRKARGSTRPQLPVIPAVGSVGPADGAPVPPLIATVPVPAARTPSASPPRMPDVPAPREETVTQPVRPPMAPVMDHATPEATTKASPAALEPPEPATPKPKLAKPAITKTSADRPSADRPSADKPSPLVPPPPATGRPKHGPDADDPDPALEPDA